MSPQARPRSENSVRAAWLVALALVGLGAGAVRIVHVRSILSSPIGETVVEDARHYHLEALRIAGTAAPLPPADVSFMNLGYPYFLAAVYRLAGDGIGPALILQALLGAIVSVLLASAGRSLFRSAEAGIWGGTLHAAYAGGVFYDGLLLTPSPTNAALGVAIWSLARAVTAGGRLPAASAGVAVGIASVLRSNVLLLAVLVLAYLFLLGRGTTDLASARRGAAFAAGVALVVAPVVLYGGFRHGSWVPISANGGMNFWIGNRAGADGTYSAPEFLEEQSAGSEGVGFLQEARRRTGNPSLTLAASSHYWFAEGLREIRAHPASWLQLEAMKLALFWSRHETKTNVAMSFMDGLSPVLRLTPVRFAWLAVLGIGGIVYLLRERAAAAVGLIGCIVLSAWGTCAAFFISGEYRHPASLALCLAAGALLAAGRRSIGGGAPRKGRRSLAWAVAAAAAAVPLVAWSPSSLEAASHPFIDYSNYARAILSPDPSGGPPAPEDYRRALALLDRAPDDATKRLFLLDARLWVRFKAATELGDREEASAAIHAAAAVRDEMVSSGGRGYSDAYLRQLSSSLRGRVALLARSVGVQNDPALSAAAERLRLSLEPAETILR